MKEREIDVYRDYTNINPVATYFDYNRANEEIKQQQGEPTQPLYQAPVNPGFDYGKANAEIAQQNVTAPADPNQVVEDIYNPPTPKYDQARQDRLKRLAKLNFMGKGLGALGDIFSLSQGAIVNRRQPDGKAERLYDMFQGYDDDYSRRMDQHNRDQFNLRLQQIREGKQDKWRHEDMTFRRGEAARSQYNTDRQFGAMELDREERRKDREQGREFQEKNMERMQEQFEKQHGLAWAQLNWQQQKTLMDHAMKVQQEGNKNAFRLYSSNGKEMARVDQKGGVDALLSVILGDTGAATEIDVLKAQFGEGLSPEIKRYLVGKYWEKSPAAVKWLEGNGQLSSGTTQKETDNAWLDGLGVKPGATPAAAPQPQQNKAESKPQYSTGGYY